MKTLATENEFIELEKSQHQIENPVNIKNKIKIDQMKQNIIKEFSKVTNPDMKNRAPQQKMTKIAKKYYHLLKNFKLNLMLLNEIIYTTATVISPVTIAHNKIALSNSNGN